MDQQTLIKSTNFRSHQEKKPQKITLEELELWEHQILDNPMTFIKNLSIQLMIGEDFLEYITTQNLEKQLDFAIHLNDLLIKEAKLKISEVETLKGKVIQAIFEKSQTKAGVGDLSLFVESMKKETSDKQKSRWVTFLGKIGVDTESGYNNSNLEWVRTADSKIQINSQVQSIIAKMQRDFDQLKKDQESLKRAQKLEILRGQSITNRKNNNPHYYSEIATFRLDDYPEVNILTKLEQEYPIDIILSLGIEIAQGIAYLSQLRKNNASAELSCSNQAKFLKNVHIVPIFRLLIDELNSATEWQLINNGKEYSKVQSIELIQLYKKVLQPKQLDYIAKVIGQSIDSLVAKNDIKMETIVDFLYRLYREVGFQVFLDEIDFIQSDTILEAARIVVEGY